MAKFKCCFWSGWVRTADLGHANSVEANLGECSRCKKPWVHLYVVANHRTLYERIEPNRAAMLLAISDPKEKKDALRTWLDENDN